jgi:DNA-binding beta-propeller fold protein YncE
MRMVAVAVLAAGAGVLAGCGNTYRPVVATIGVVGPAGQPQKYAIAVSTPTKIPASGPINFIGTWNAATTYALNQGVSYLGSQYVSLQNGNVNQNPVTATAYWAVLSNGLLTMVDFSGDTVLITATLGLNPYYMALNASGTNVFTLNADKTMTSADLSTSLISSQVLESTLPPGANPVSIFVSNTSTYLADPGVAAVDQLASTPPALKEELPVTNGYSPLYVVGLGTAPRAYAINPSTSGGPGQVAAIETGTNTISTTLPVGRGPVYGVMTGDQRRVFILNQTDGTVSVINAQTNALDSLPSTSLSTIPVGVRPVWADLAAGLDELVVANEGNGTTSPGSVTIVNIPLCSATALPTNPNCNPANPIDATTFGQVVATVPVGINPIMVSVLSDFTRAYVANAGNPALPCAANGVAVAGVSTTCTVSVVNLLSNTVTATIPINGHPAYIATSAATPTGKVYVVCNDSQVMTVIETDTDSLDTTIPLQGYGVSVRASQP